MVYYFALSFRLGVGMVAFSAITAWVVHVVDQSAASLLWVSVAVFIVAWIFQFVGHKIEGKKPSFSERHPVPADWAGLVDALPLPACRPALLKRNQSALQAFTAATL